MISRFISSNYRKPSTFLIYPFYLFICMAFSINIVHIFTQIFDIKINKGGYWSAGLLISIVLFSILWLYVNKVFSKALIGYLIINLTVISLDMLSYYILKSTFFPKLLNNIFSPYIVNIFNNLLASLL
jgi:hypothetical protein